MAIPAFVSNDILVITPSDTVQLPQNGCVVCKTAAGNVVVTTAAGSKVTYPIALGETLPVYVNQVWATNTTATGLYLFPI